MRHLTVYIEIDGKQTYVGNIDGNSVDDARFAYAKEYYMNVGHHPVSVSLPLNDAPFSPQVTRNFFEGLLPD